MLIAKNIYSVQLSTLVDGEIPVVHCTNTNSFMLPFQTAFKHKDEMYWRKLSTSPDDIEGITEAKKKALVDPDIVGMEDVSYMYGKTKLFSSSGTVMQFPTYHIKTLLKKSDFLPEVEFVSPFKVLEKMKKAKKLIDNLPEWMFQNDQEKIDYIKNARSIFMPIKREQHRIDYGVQRATEYYLKRLNEVPVFSQ